MIAVRSDRKYSFSVWRKSNEPAAAENANATILFLNAEREPVGEPVLSLLQNDMAEWTLLTTPSVRPTDGAYFARLIAGVSGATDGAVWFDDASLNIEEIEGAAEPNLVPNGNFESVEDGVLTG